MSIQHCDFQIRENTLSKYSTLDLNTNDGKSRFLKPNAWDDPLKPKTHYHKLSTQKIWGYITILENVVENLPFTIEIENNIVRNMMRDPSKFGWNPIILKKVTIDQNYLYAQTLWHHMYI